MRLFLIHRDDIETYWPELEPLFERVAEKAVLGEFSAADIKRMALNDAIMLMASGNEEGEIHMAMAFEFVTYPSGKMGVNVFAMGGKNLIPSMEELFEEFQGWCRDFGADWIECLVSPGMERMHKRNGFKTVYKSMRFLL